MKKITFTTTAFNFRAIKINTLIFIVLVLTSAQLISQTTYTFTNCGATGNFGPTQTQVTAAYAATNLSLVATTNATSGIQTWTVPVSGNYQIEVWGAKGGDGAGMLGGNGARMQGDFVLTGGAVLKIVVGQLGGSRANTGSNSAGAGGGGSFVTYINNVPIIVAGGGGGAGSSQSGLVGDVGLNGTQSAGSSGIGGTNGGGGGGALSGTSGTSLTPGGMGTSCSYGAGGGGFYTIGGYNCSAALPLISGFSFTSGALGGDADVGRLGVPGGFGGGAGVGHRASGGGGWSGGGGDGNLGGGGGGGSYNSGTNQVNVSGFNSGHGRVRITTLCSISVGSSVNPMCIGAAATLTTNAVSNYTWSTGSNAASIVVSPTTTTTYTLIAMSPSACIASNVITLTVSPGLPSLTVSASSNSVCLGNTVTLTGSGALTYSWTGGVQNGLTYTPTVTQGYTVVGQNGCGVATAVTSVTVFTLPVVGTFSPLISCAGVSSTLTGTGATTYTWLPGGLVGVNVLVGPMVSTTYTVTGSTGGCLGVNTLVINPNPNPTVTAISTGSMICTGTSVTLTATGAIGYTWQPVNQIGSSIVVTPTAPTAYVVTGVNSFGCNANASVPVIALPSPTLVVSMTNSIICLGGSVTMGVSGANTYLWSTSSTASAITQSPGTTTSYTVTGTNTGSGCTDTEIITIQVFVPTIGVSQPTSVCLGSSVILLATGATNYTWSTGIQGNSITVSPAISTNYTVYGSSIVGGMNCAGNNTTAVTVNPLPVVTATTSRPNICKGESTTITGLGATNYSWTTSQTINPIVVTPTAQTTYTVTGIDGNNCSSTAVIQIKVFNCTGISEANLNSEYLVQVFPNPNNGEFVIKTQKSMELEIVNELGQVIRVIHLNSANNNEVVISGLPSGIYILTGRNNLVETHHKIVVSK